MSASTVPTVLAALVAAARVALPGWAVFDGQPDTQTDQDFAAIGWHDEESAVSLSVSSVDLGAMSDRESYDVRCMVSAWTGDDDPGWARTRVFGALDALTDTLAVDQTLSGACMRADVAGADLTQELNKGSVATLAITVHVEAFRS